MYVLLFVIYFTCIFSLHYVQQKFTWRDEDATLIYRAWKASCTRRYADMLGTARKHAMQTIGMTNLLEMKGHPPQFLTAAVWNELIDKYWSTPKWL